MTKEEMRHKIDYEIVVDAYDEHEVNMSWYYYFEETMEFPFVAETVIKFRNGKKRLAKVDVLGLVKDSHFEESPDILFEVSPQDVDLVLEVRVSGLSNVKGPQEVKEAFLLWHFWKFGDD